MMSFLKAACTYLLSSEFRRHLLLCFTMGCGIFDVSSDVFSTQSFFASGRNEIAYALLSTILLSYTIQAIFVLLVHRRQGTCARVNVGLRLKCATFSSASSLSSIPIG
jgi:hypothetical protein